jgi:hypothetical protein
MLVLPTEVSPRRITLKAWVFCWEDKGEGEDESATFCMGYETFMEKVTGSGFFCGFFQVWEMSEWKVRLFVWVMKRSWGK